MRRSGLWRGLALMLIVTTASMLWVTPAGASGNALFSGRVFQPDGVAPRSGVVVALFDETSGEVFRSEPTNDEGAFRIEQAPPGSYAVVTETSGGAFLADGEIQLKEGTNQPLSLTLTSTPPAGALAPAQTGAQQKSGMSTAVKWIITGGIIVAALFVVNELTEDSEETASDF